MLSVNLLRRRALRVGLIFALLHLFIFVLFDFFVASNGGQFALLYVVFVIADFPVSILYFFSGTGVFSYVSDRIYLPYLIHGCFGTMWWFFISFFLCLFVKRRSLLKRAN